jgi:F-type H+-transporting ATPase subunit b
LGLVELSFEGADTWLNYPGLELWKFVNLLLFIAAVIYLHHRFGNPLSEALRLRRERIKRELEKAREEQAQAVTRLAEVDSRIKLLDSEVTLIVEQAKREAEAERGRIKLATEAEITKLRQHAQREIESASKAAVLELRRFAAEQSVTMAKESIEREIRSEDDARLISLSVEQLGRSSL